MSTTVTIEVEARFEATVRLALALAEEMEHLALASADGAVLAACEEAIIAQGRKLQSHVLGEAVARRIDAAEKKGRRSGSVNAAARGPIAVPKNAG